MRRECGLPLVLVLLGAMLVARARAAPRAGFAIGWYVMGGGGGQSASQGFGLAGTAGQAAAGPLSSESYQVGAGYWGDATVTVGPVRYGVYLPVVVRGMADGRR
jgi:hypothetical protein